MDFDEILSKVCTGLPAVEINAGLSRVPKFYWGRDADLPTFLAIYKEQHFPFIWSVSKADAQTDDEGVWRRDAEILICTRETRKDLLNTTRISEGYSFKKVLDPVWVSLQRVIDLSENISIREGTITRTKIPNYSAGAKLEQAELWDVLRITFTADFNNDYQC